MAPNAKYIALNGTAGDFMRKMVSDVIHINVQRKNTKMIIAKATTADLQTLGQLATEGKQRFQP